MCRGLGSVLSNFSRTLIKKIFALIDNNGLQIAVKKNIEK